MDTKINPDCGTYIDIEETTLSVGREQRLHHFLQNWVAEGIVHQCVAQHAWDIWRWLFILSKNRLSVPDAADGNTGEIFLIWAEGKHSLEIELSLPDECFVFYKDSESLEHYFYEGKAEKLPYEEMRHVISYFV